MAEAEQQDTTSLPIVSVPKAISRVDFATILGLILSFGLIASAIAIGKSDANFFNIPSVLIVVLGTLTATCTSFTGAELMSSGKIIFGAAVRPSRNLSAMATSLISLAIISRKKGLLFLSSYESETSKEPFLHHTLGIAIDGYSEADVNRIMQQSIDLEEERHKRAASILRRASEVAPAMGLIGTLVGLVQMLANLENPDTIGPAMAVALLTTFYGAILGTVVFAPLASKLEKNADDEVTLKTMVLKASTSMIKQENPRNLEMVLNSLLPASQRVNYYN